MNQNIKWSVAVRVEPHLSWEFQVQSLEEALPTVNELLCHALHCGGKIHSVQIHVSAPASQGWLRIGECGNSTLIPSPSAQQGNQRQVDPFGTHMVIVPIFKPQVVPEHNVLTTALDRFADLHWVVVAAFCALLAGMCNVFVFVSWNENSNGKVMRAHPVSTICFVTLALNCVVLVLHRVNRHVAHIALQQPEPLLVLFLVVRQWASLTYRHVAILGDWRSWSDDLCRLVIDLMFFVCITACDAWHVRTIVKCLFLACCLTWSVIKLFIGWGKDGSVEWFDILLGHTCYVSSWIAIVLFISKALLSLLRGNDFVFCTGELEIRRGGRSRSKVWHSCTMKNCLAACCNFYSSTRSAGLEYLQSGPEIVSTNSQGVAWPPQRHNHHPGTDVDVESGSDGVSSSFVSDPSEVS